MRQKDKAVADISPAEGQPIRDTWAVALGKNISARLPIPLLPYLLVKDETNKIF